jgi:hypothetical protein
MVSRSTEPQVSKQVNFSGMLSNIYNFNKRGVLAPQRYQHWQGCLRKSLMVTLHVPIDSVNVACPNITTVPMEHD